MTYRQRFFLFICLDSMMLPAGLFLVRWLLRTDGPVMTGPFLAAMIGLLLCHHVFAAVYQLYQQSWEYASIGELLIIMKVLTCSVLVVGVLQGIVYQGVFTRVMVVSWMFFLLQFGGMRLGWRIFRDRWGKRRINTKRTLIVGAGSAGTMVCRQLLGSKQTELQPVAFVDDNTNKHHLHILGIPVVGGVDQLQSIVEEYDIDHIIIAIPSLGRKALNRICGECTKTKVKTQMMPMLEHLVTGKISVSEFRDIQVEDLLGREPVDLDMDSISESMHGKVVLVTGAGGSIGSEICRQVARFHPEQLILLGHGENSIYDIHLELRELYGDAPTRFIPVIADLKDAERMMAVMSSYSPHVVYHAAAHKHVPLMEAAPREAVKNNMIGTWNAARAASACKVNTFVMISTDKAVNPTSVMGATKRMAEMIIQHMDRVSPTRFVAVRFGNVLGSSGSVIPLFKRQIERGGPVTVTHPDMVRYFMTIPEASRLVIQAGALARGGEIFVLDMGEPVSILGLAKNLIRLSGYTEEEIGITYTGIRPGEKLFEELLQEDEIYDEQVYPQIYIGKSTDVPFVDVEKLMAGYEGMLDAELRKRLLDMANRKVSMPELVSISG